MKAFVIIVFYSVLMMIYADPDSDKASSNGEIICPDGLSQCPSTSTCCISNDGDYSCCPIEEGVCCADHIHCCPKHYKCDLKIFKCDRVFNAKMLAMTQSLNKN